MEGLERLVSAGPVDNVDFQTPWQGRWRPEEFLVEPVAPTTNRLCQRNRRGNCIADRRERNMGPTSSNPGAHRPKAHRPPDP